jgi:high-affinity nickel-transport protein
LLTLSASTATSGTLPALAVLTLPLLFAAGMSALDTFDSLLMTRAYSWAYRSPARKLFYNIATTGMTVVVATLVGTVYLAGLLVDQLHVAAWLTPYASIADHFELLGYVIVGFFVGAWLTAALTWRLGGFQRRYGGAGA